MNTYKRHRFPLDIISHGGEARKIVTDKLHSYGVAHRELMPDVIHDNSQYANNRAEQSHEATKVRERGMWWPDISEFKSVRQAQRFLGAHAAVSNLFNIVPPSSHLCQHPYYSFQAILDTRSFCKVLQVNKYKMPAKP